MIYHIKVGKYHSLKGIHNFNSLQELVIHVGKYHNLKGIHNELGHLSIMSIVGKYHNLKGIHNKNNCILKKFVVGKYHSLKDIHNCRSGEIVCKLVGKYHSLKGIHNYLFVDPGYIFVGKCHSLKGIIVGFPIGRFEGYIAGSEDENNLDFEEFQGEDFYKTKVGLPLVFFDRIRKDDEILVDKISSKFAGYLALHFIYDYTHK